MHQDLLHIMESIMDKRFSSVLNESPTSQPPTPPHDLDKDIDFAMQFLDTSYQLSPTKSLKRRSAPPELVTPPTSSPTPARHVDVVDDPRRPTKKIRFSPTTHEIKTSIPLSSITPNTCRLVSHTTPNGSQRPKSILKVSTPLQKPVLPISMTQPRRQPPHKFHSFESMLDSILKQLHGGERSVRLESYMDLIGTLKAYQAELDPAPVLAKIALFETCLRGDLGAKNPATNAIDTDIVSQALKLAAVLIRTPIFLNMISRDFLVELLDRSLLVLKDTSTPKAVLTAYLMLLAQTPILKRVGTYAHLNAMISTLKDLHKSYQGNTMLSLSLSIYTSLVDRANPLMLDMVGHWIGPVFQGMLSESSDTRSRAIETALKAGMVLGSSKRAAKTVQAFLNKVSGGATPYEHLEKHLWHLLEAKEHAAQVPRIWSAVVLLLRGIDNSLNNWPHVTSWMKIIQRCFNSSDKAVNIQAYLAWGKLIYAVDVSSELRPSMIKALRQPIVSRLSTTPKDQEARFVWDTAFACYRALLYYGLRPNAEPAKILQSWKQFVESMTDTQALQSKDYSACMCLILDSLLGNVDSSIWDERRAVSKDNNFPSLAELPRLKPWWIRRHFSSVIGVVERIVHVTQWDGRDGSNATIQVLWVKVMKAVHEAGLKEVMVSIDLKMTVSESVNVLCRLWNSGPQSLDTRNEESGVFRARFAYLSLIAIQSLGQVNFGDRILCRLASGEYELRASGVKDEYYGALLSPIESLSSLMAKEDHDTLWISKSKNSSEELLHTFLNTLSIGGTDIKDKEVAMKSLTDDKEDHSSLMASDVWKRFRALVLGIQPSAPAAQDLVSSGLNLNSVTQSPVHSMQSEDSIGDLMIAATDTNGKAGRIVSPSHIDLESDQASLTNDASSIMQAQLSSTRSILTDSKAQWNASQAVPTPHEVAASAEYVPEHDLPQQPGLRLAKTAELRSISTTEDANIEIFFDCSTHLSDVNVSMDIDTSLEPKNETISSLKDGKVDTTEKPISNGDSIVSGDCLEQITVTALDNIEPLENSEAGNLDLHGDGCDEDEDDMDTIRVASQPHPSERLLRSSQSPLLPTPPTQKRARDNMSASLRTSMSQSKKRAAESQTADNMVKRRRSARLSSVATSTENTASDSNRDDLGKECEDLTTIPEVQEACHGMATRSQRARSKAHTSNPTSQDIVQSAEVIRSSDMDNGAIQDGQSPPPQARVKSVIQKLSDVLQMCRTLDFGMITYESVGQIQVLAMDVQREIIDAVCRSRTVTK